MVGPMALILLTDTLHRASPEICQDRYKRSK